ncbi:MAG: TerD family protein [Prochloraceae cyanobacterium]
MSINLQKGQRISLKKESPGLTSVLFGLGWDVAQPAGGFLSIFKSNSNLDLDASVLCLNANGKLDNNTNVIYYNNLSHVCGGITHLGDNLTGEGEGDDEQILVDLPKIPETIAKLVFVVSIFQALERQQDFGQVDNAFVRLVDTSNNREIARYNLSGQEYQGSTGMIMAQIHRDNNGWNMEAIGEGIKISGLQQLVNLY